MWAGPWPFWQSIGLSEMDWIDLMDDDKQPLENGIELPDSLVDRFNKFEVRLRKMETVVTICGALFGVLLTYGLLFISDRFWDTPAALRGLLTLAGGSACGYFSWHWLSHWYFRRRGSRELARMIQRHHKGMGDRLLGVVELAEGGALPENVSPALCRAAIEQVARESEKYDFTQALWLANRGICLRLLRCIVIGSDSVFDFSGCGFERVETLVGSYGRRGALHLRKFRGSP